MKCRKLKSSYEQTRLNKIICLFMMCCWVTLVEAKQYKFEMTIEEVTIKVAPKLDYKVFAFNGQVPAPLIHVREGDDVEVLVTNNTSTAHTIH